MAPQSEVNQHISHIGGGKFFNLAATAWFCKFKISGHLLGTRMVGLAPRPSFSGNRWLGARCGLLHFLIYSHCFLIFLVHFFSCCSYIVGLISFFILTCSFYYFSCSCFVYVLFKILWCLILIIQHPGYPQLTSLGNSGSYYLTSPPLSFPLH